MGVSWGKGEWEYYLGIGFGLGGHFWKGGGGGGGMDWNFRPRFFLRDLEVRRILLRSCGVGSAVLDVGRISGDGLREVRRRNAAAVSACGYSKACRIRLGCISLLALSLNATC